MPGDSEVRQVEEDLPEVPDRGCSRGLDSDEPVGYGCRVCRDSVPSLSVRHHHWLVRMLSGVPDCYCTNLERCLELHVHQFAFVCVFIGKMGIVGRGRKGKQENNKKGKQF